MGEKRLNFQGQFTAQVLPSHFHYYFIFGMENKSASRIRIFLCCNQSKSFPEILFLLLLQCQNLLGQADEATGFQSTPTITLVHLPFQGLLMSFLMIQLSLSILAVSVTSEFLLLFSCPVHKQYMLKNQKLQLSKEVTKNHLARERTFDIFQHRLFQSFPFIFLYLNFPLQLHNL